MSIENPILAHFRHFRSLLTNFFSTTVVSALQIHLFMQNEPKFRKSQMNVNKVLTKDYDKRTLGQRRKNEPKTNPNEPNSCPPSVWRDRAKKMLLSTFVLWGLG